MHAASCQRQPAVCHKHTQQVDVLFVQNCEYAHARFNQPPRCSRWPASDLITPLTGGRRRLVGRPTAACSIIASDHGNMQLYQHTAERHAAEYDAPSLSRARSPSFRTQRTSIIFKYQAQALSGQRPHFHICPHRGNLVGSYSRNY